MNVKKIGDDWSVQVTQSSIFAATRGDEPQFNQYVLNIVDSISHATKAPTVIHGFADDANSDDRRRVVFTPARVMARIVVMDKQKHLGLAKVPLAMRTSTRTIGPNWNNITLGFMDFVEEAKKNEVQPKENPFEMRIKHPWYDATITQLAQPVGGIQPFTGHFLVESTNKAIVEVDKAKGIRTADIFSLRRLKEPLMRRYIIAPSAFYDERHPADDLCFSYGLFGSAIYFVEGNELWKHGALFHQHKT